MTTHRARGAPVTSVSGRLSVGVAVHGAPSLGLATKDMRAAVLGLLRRTAVDGRGVALETHGVGEVVPRHLRHRIPLVALQVREPGGNLPERGGDLDGPAF